MHWSRRQCLLTRRESMQDALILFRFVLGDIKMKTVVCWVFHSCIFCLPVQHKSSLTGDKSENYTSFFLKFQVCTNALLSFHTHREEFSSPCLKTKTEQPKGTFLSNSAAAVVPSARGFRSGASIHQVQELSLKGISSRQTASTKLIYLEYNYVTVIVRKDKRALKWYFTPFEQ